MMSGISGFASTYPYSQFYNSPEFMKNEMSYLQGDIKNQESEWKESQEEMQQSLSSLQDKTP